ncbi:MAG: hypothetical protein QM718_07495 [Steroidobacteraceae bacterium]
MPNWILDLTQRISDTHLAEVLGNSALAYGFIEGIHLLGLSISVGLIALTDLRLLGLILARVPVTDMLRQLRPLILTGFALIFLSGVLLFWSEAASVIESPPFPFKFLFIALAGVNALYFELIAARQPEVIANHARLPRNVRCAGAASLLLWTLVIICGRLIPYLPNWQALSN